MNLSMLDHLIARIATKRAFVMPKKIEGNLTILQDYQISEQRYLHLPARENTTLPGQMSLFADTRRRQAVVEFVEEIDSEGQRAAIYRVTDLIAGDFKAGDRVWLSGWLNSAENLCDLTALPIKFGPNSRGLFVEAESKNWVIHVHGWNASVDETTRTFGSLHKAAYNNLALAWPSDLAPWGSGQRFCHYGATESHALSDAVDFARAQGAQKVFLFGYSMGTTLIANYLASNFKDGEFPDWLGGVVLDSPLVDLRHTLTASMVRLNVTARRIELSLALGQKRFAKMQSSFEQLSYSHLPTFPKTLVFYASKDEFLDMAPVAKMVAAHPEMIQTQTVESAGHCRTFNQDPEAYIASMLSFLEAAQ